VSWVLFHYAYPFLKDVRPRLKGNKLKAFQHLTKKERRILVVGDLHCPFDLDSYLPFLLETYAKWNCNQILMIGDAVDNHYSSFHQTDADGYGGGEELDRAIKRLSKYRDAFAKICDKKIEICIGNHDRIIMRRAFDSDIPARWIKSYNEVLGTDWNWVESIVYDDVLYEHGEGGQAKTKAKNNMMSSVCGHTHTQAYVEWLVGKKYRVFGMQVGCGVDASTYAAAYAKNFKKQAIGCGVILGGHTAINILMPLGKPKPKPTTVL
jgi:predicted phosphodiesterase